MVQKNMAKTPREGRDIPFFGYKFFDKDITGSKSGPAIAEPAGSAATPLTKSYQVICLQLLLRYIPRRHKYQQLHQER